MWAKKLPAYKAPAPVRSRNMAAIRSRGNFTTELRLRSLLVREGIRGWKLHGLKEIGSPDFVFPDLQVAVFVHGCFWHGCPRCGHVPRANALYWSAKIERNQQRDRMMSRAARSRGYQVVRIWECVLRKRPRDCLERIYRVISRNASRAHSRGRTEIGRRGGGK